MSMKNFFSRFGPPLLGVLLSTAALMPLAHAQAPAPAIGVDAARHLLNRTGFAANDGEIRTFAALSRAQAADRLLEATRLEAAQKPPAWVNEAPIAPARRAPTRSR